MALHGIVASPLEDWFRTRYFAAKTDISSSGVENYSLGDLRRILGVSAEELDAIAFRDSPSLGSDRLRQAIAGRFASAPERAMVTHGSTEGLFLALTALLRPGDEVVVLRPVYQSLHSIAESLGATLRVWELDPADGFRPDPERLRALMTSRTRAVVVNFPHNPLGVTLSRPAYDTLVELVADSGAYLLWDNAFGELVYDEPALPEPTGTYKRALSFGTLSKAYGLPGMRVGWCTGPTDVLNRMVELRDYVSLNTSPLTEFLAERVLHHGDALVAPRLEQARRNREVLMGWAADHPELVDLPRPSGGVSAFPRFQGPAQVDEACEELADVHGVLVVPGSCFGHPDRMRIGFGGPTEELRHGLRAVADVVARTADKEGCLRWPAL